MELGQYNTMATEDGKDLNTETFSFSLTIYWQACFEEKRTCEK